MNVETAVAIVSTAKQHIGVPFTWGGETPAGFDCSGFTQYVMKQNGISVPRKVAEQYLRGIQIRNVDLEPGDLVFFTTYEEGATHVGIYTGGSDFIHASQLPEPGQVMISSLNTNYCRKHYIGARRYIQDGER